MDETTTELASVAAIDERPNKLIDRLRQFWPCDSLWQQRNITASSRKFEVIETSTYGYYRLVVAYIRGMVVPLFSSNHLECLQKVVASMRHAWMSVNTFFSFPVENKPSLVYIYIYILETCTMCYSRDAVSCRVSSNAFMVMPWSEQD